MKTKYLFIPMMASLFAFTSCSSSDDSNGSTIKTPSSLSTSTASTYVSLYTSSETKVENRILPMPLLQETQQL